MKLNVSFILLGCTEQNAVKSICLIEDYTNENKLEAYEIILVSCNKPGIHRLYQMVCRGNVKGLVITEQFGSDALIMAGLNYSQGDVVICMNLELDCYQELLPLLLTRISTQYEAVCVKNETDIINSYFAITRNVVDCIIKYNKPYPHIIGFIQRSTNFIDFIMYAMNDKNIIFSNEGKKRKILNVLNKMTYSIKPLRIATFLGFLFAFIGFGYGIIIIVLKVFNKITVVGFSTIIALCVFFGGLIMVMLGVLGEYIGRIYITISSAPQYVIKERYNLK